VAKLPCELQIRSFREYFGRPDYTILRPHNVYGPRQNISDPYRNVVGIFMRSALDGEPFPIFGDGLQTRSFSFVSQASHAIAFAPLIPAARNGVFNVGDYGPTTVARLAEMVAETMGVPLKIHRLPARKEVLHAHADHAKPFRVFAGHLPPGVPLREGLTIMATHVRVTRTPTPCPSPIDIRDGLPPSWDSHG
jgi:UDP-glucose 4-epimerase